MTVHAGAKDEFDTMAAVHTLEAAGVERKHAEAHAGVLRRSRSGLATKADLDNLERRLLTQIDARMERAEKRALAVLVTVAAAAIAAAKYL